MPITFKTVAGDREYRIMKGVYGHLIQSKNGNLFTLDNGNNLRVVDTCNVQYLQSLTDGERLKFLRNTFGISQRELARMYGVRQAMVAHWEADYRHIAPKRFEQIEATLFNAYIRTASRAGLPVGKEN
jgi:DNA-binding transcriptional regulator YiaG